MNQQLSVAVLFGGCSPEYSVSLESAHAVISCLDRERYHPVLIGISQEGRWFHYTGDPDRIPADRWLTPQDCTPAVVSPSRGDTCLLAFHDNGQVEKVPIDVAFPVLHGKNGEDGSVQGLFQLAGIPVVGCGVLSSALCMDKDRAHILAHAAGIAVPASFTLEEPWDEESAARQAQALGYPLFVKPVKAGSSYGITRVTKPEGLSPAIRLAFSYDDRVIVEEEITGFEVGTAVLGNQTLTVGEPDEIELSGGFFDFTEKYTLKTSAIHVPARIAPETAAQLKQAAQTVYRALDCHGFARVDFFLDNQNRIVFNEANTIPGFTAHSRYPSMMKAAGMEFPQIISAAIELAVRP